MSEISQSPGISWAVPEELGIPPDKLRLRLDFFHQATTITYFEEDTVTTKVVDASDVAHALARDLTFGSGLLPNNTLWWQNSRGGAVTALYAEPRTRKIALELNPELPPKRFNIPMPGLIFLCTPGQAPWVYAVKKKPTKVTDTVYRAPLLNIYNSGMSCPGSHKYPTRIADMVESFFMAFFSHAGHKGKRSVKYPDDIQKLWESLSPRQKYPLDDLVPHGTVKDLMNMDMNAGQVAGGLVNEEADEGDDD